MYLKHLITNILTLYFFLSLASCNTAKKTTTKVADTSTTTDSIIVKKENPPVLITPKKIKRKIYANIAHHVQVHTPEGHTNNIEFSAPGCKVDTIDKKKGIYSLRTARAGLLVEAIARDRNSEKLTFTTFEVVEIPAPLAKIGINRQAVKDEIITSTNIKLKSALMLTFTEAVPVLCSANSFTLTRIDSDGKRESVVNKNPLGTFENPTQELINKAQSGDIYIFSNIENNCTPKQVQNVAYILEN